jgi:hypothetical protein
MANARNAGGEPVAVVAAVQAVLVMMVSFGWLDGIGLHSQHDVGLVVIVVSALGAVYQAWITHRTLLAPLVQLVQASVSLGAIYGLHITTEQTGMLVTAITAVFAAFHWNATSPLERGSFKLAA